MKKISNHLAEIVIALAGIMLIITAISLFSAPIGTFFGDIVDKEVDVGENMLNGMEDVELNISPVYKIIKGAGQTYSEGTLSFTSNAPFSKFAGVKVNNELVDPVNYTVEEGSTIVTFTEAYSSLLANGDYKIEVLATDGAASAPFDVSISNDVPIPVANDWEPMTWGGLTSFSALNVWTDGTDIYYSDYMNHYVLNGTTWETVTWTSNYRGFTGDFSGWSIWTDGTNTYYSDGMDNYKLNAATKQWEFMFFGGETFNPDASYIWTDGSSIYHSRNASQYVLNGTTWEPMTWSGLTSFQGGSVWKDGANIYYSNWGEHYKLNGTTWEPMTWDGLTSFNGDQVWNDTVNTYYSNGDKQYVLNGTTWEEKTWTGLTSFSGNYTWSDGNNVYYSKGNSQYVNVN